LKVSMVLLSNLTVGVETSHKRYFMVVQLLKKKRNKVLNQALHRIASLWLAPGELFVIWLNISVSFKTDNLYFYEKEFGICI